MDTFEVDYSTKNIPIPTRKGYMKNLLEQVECVIKRMRWKAFFFLNQVSDDTRSEIEDSDEESNNDLYGKFGLKSKKTPPPVEEMAEFEKDMLDMVERIEFKPVSDQFQTKLKHDMKKIHDSDKILVQADKSRNIYKMDNAEYSKLLAENITQKYKIADDKVVDAIDKEANEIAAMLNLSDRIDRVAKKEAFITLKDHKENFQSRPKCRLINPTKNEIGKVSKIMLDRINTAIREKSKANQWRNTASVINWFNDLSEKSTLSFLQFDIVDFYPSISENLLKEALAWAEKFTKITDLEYETIMHSRKTILFDNREKPWTKKDSANTFDVAMGAFDGAEICELVGLLILHELNTELGAESVGLYRDDGLAALRKCSGSQAERMRKMLAKIFKKFGLSITAEANIRTVSFLDVTFDLATGTHKPYRKPNNPPLYINIKSNHPPIITKNLPEAIGKRITSLSSNRAIFEEAATTYSNALQSCGYTERIHFDESSTSKPETSEDSTRIRCRRRRIIWFNPPYSMNVKTNVGGIFMKLVHKHFPRESHLHKIFNKNNIKISYGCTRNMGNIINSHNAHIRSKEKEATTKKMCNCRKRDDCPLNGKCLSKSIVYKAEVKSGNIVKQYIGLAGNTFKERFNNHTKSIRLEKYKKETELSKYVWDLKDKGKEYEIKYKIVCQSNTATRKSGICNLCLDEKFYILFVKQENKVNLLNKRSEMISKCRHGNRPSNQAKKK